MYWFKFPRCVGGNVSISYQAPISPSPGVSAGQYDPYFILSVSNWCEGSHSRMISDWARTEVISCPGHKSPDRVCLLCDICFLIVPSGSSGWQVDHTCCLIPQQCHTGQCQWSSGQKLLV